MQKFEEIFDQLIKLHDKAKLIQLYFTRSSGFARCIDKFSGTMVSFSGSLTAVNWKNKPTNKPLFNSLWLTCLVRPVPRSFIVTYFYSKRRFQHMIQHSDTFHRCTFLLYQDNLRWCDKSSMELGDQTQKHMNLCILLFLPPILFLYS